MTSLLFEKLRPFPKNADSPVFASAIKPKDIIESINGQDAVSMTMKVIREVSQSHDGDKVSLKVRRGDNALKFKFTLKQAI